MLWRANLYKSALQIPKPNMSGLNGFNLKLPKKSETQKPSQKYRLGFSKTHFCNAAKTCNVNGHIITKVCIRQNNDETNSWSRWWDWYRPRHSLNFSIHGPSRYISRLSGHISRMSRRRYLRDAGTMNIDWYDDSRLQVTSKSQIKSQIISIKLALF